MSATTFAFVHEDLSWAGARACRFNLTKSPILTPTANCRSTVKYSPNTACGLKKGRSLAAETPCPTSSIA
jgi:hypothetical protein